MSGKVEPLVNAECACCNTGIFVTGDASRPTARVPGTETALVFCDAACKGSWENKHCYWCGEYHPQGSPHTVETQQGEKQAFCGLDHQSAMFAHVCKKLSAAT